ncbi:MAG: TVP38/TMEM64 family protein [Pseudomonadota bacterium]
MNKSRRPTDAICDDADGPKAASGETSQATDTDRPAADTPSRTEGFSIRRLWPVALIATLMAAFYLSGGHTYISLDTIIRERDTLAAVVEKNLALVAAGYLCFYALAVAISFPGASLITVVGGFLFGWILGGLLTVIAATTGASIVFLAAKTSFGTALRARAGRWTGRLASGFEENAFGYLLFLRLAPIFPFWLINVAPTMFNVSVRTYVAATALGIIPGTFAYSLLGDGLGATITDLEAKDPGCAAAGTCEIGLGALFSPGLLMAMGALVVVSFIPILVKRMRARQDKPL